jgi:hypothetical protein
MITAKWKVTALKKSQKSCGLLLHIFSDAAVVDTPISLY